WLEDGTIVLALQETGAWRVPASGGRPERLADAGPSVRAVDGTRPVLGFNLISSVPGAAYVLASIWDGDTLEDYSIVTVSLKDGSMRTVIRNATDAHFLAPDRLLFVRGASLMSAPFDRFSGALTGEPVPVLDGMCINRWADKANLAVSPGGTLAYVPGGR